MKRWQSKNERIMVGGLMLVLMASSMASTSKWAINFESADLATTSAPKAERQTLNANQEESPQIPQQLTRRTLPTADDSSSEASGSEQQLDSRSELGTPESPEKPIKGQLNVNDRVFEATYKQDDKDQTKTLVTLEPTVETEGQACVECKTYRVPKPLNGGNLENLQAINKVLKDKIKKDQQDNKEVAQQPRRSEAPDRNERGMRPRQLSQRNNERMVDPIEERCVNKRSRDAFTICAMKELGRLANIKGDEAFDASELQDLFEQHIYTNLKDQLKDRSNKGRQDEAKIAISNLIEKLDTPNSEGLRTALTKMKQVPLMLEVQDLAILEREARSLEKTNPTRAMRLLNEFNVRRYAFQQAYNEDLMDMTQAYENLIDDDSLTRERAMNLLYDNYVDPLAAYRDALWSNDPAGALSSLPNPGLSNSINGGIRGARGGQGGGFFPPLNQSGTGGNYYPNNMNSRGFPSPGGGFNSRFANGGNNFGPMNNTVGPGNFGGMNSRFGAPNGGFNPGPVQPMNGYNPNFGGMNNGPGYNPGFNGGYGPINNGMGYGNYGYGPGMGYTNPGYLGASGPGMRPPMYGPSFGGGFGGGGFCGNIGMGMGSPYGGYGGGCGYPTSNYGSFGGGIAVTPMGGGMYPYNNGGYGMAGGMAMYPMGGPGMMYPMGGPGMSAARPRF